MVLASRAEDCFRVGEVAASCANRTLTATVVFDGHRFGPKEAATAVATAAIASGHHSASKGS